MEIKKETLLTFDDVLLVPQYSELKTRLEVDLSSSLANKIYSLPIISAPMDTITEVAMVRAMDRAGGCSVLHRWCATEELVEMFEEVKDIHPFCAIGVEDLNCNFEDLYESGCRRFCVDVAHADHVLVKETMENINKLYSDVYIMAGNVATSDGLENLIEWGAKAIKVGIGGGSICTTRRNTGHGMPLLSSIIECRKMIEHYKEVGDIVLIADGGFRTSGDIVKALAAGADFVMLGRMLAGSGAAAGKIVRDHDSRAKKVYRGLASREAQKDRIGYCKSIEGVSVLVEQIGDTETILNEIKHNIRSGFSYSGAKSLVELREKAKFVVQSHAAYVEGTAHILDKF